MHKGVLAVPGCVAHATHPAVLPSSTRTRLPHSPTSCQNPLTPPAMPPHRRGLRVATAGLLLCGTAFLLAEDLAGLGYVRTVHLRKSLFSRLAPRPAADEDARPLLETIVKMEALLRLELETEVREHGAAADKLRAAAGNATAALPPPPTSAALFRRHVSAAAPSTDDGAWAGLYKCVDQGESYTAAYLASRATFLRRPATLRDVNAPNLNMESASWWPMKGMKRGTVSTYKSIDAMDWSVSHLSMYERRLNMVHFPGGVIKDALLADMTVQLTAQETALKAAWTNASTTGRHGDDPTWEARNGTVCVMPFYAGGMGSGHSLTSTRQLYLALSVYSVLRHFPSVVVVVGDAEDEEFVRRTGLPLFDVLYHAGLPKPSALGLATVFEAQRALATNPRYSHFTSVYYTESDQVLLARQRTIGAVLRHAARGTHLLNPHRLLPLPRRSDFPSLVDRADAAAGWRAAPGAVLVGLVEGTSTKKASVRRELDLNSKRVQHQAPDEDAVSCCFDDGDCSSRKHWERMTSLPLLSVRGSYAFTAGECNIFGGTCRVCRVRDGGCGGR